MSLLTTKSLDETWAEVETALPDGWTWSISKSGPTWYAEAHPGAPMDEWDERGETAMDPSPAVALHALAAALRRAAA